VDLGFSRGNWWGALSSRYLPWCLRPFFPALLQSKMTVTVVLTCLKSTFKSVAKSPL